MVDQVLVLCCETALGVYVTKTEKKYQVVTTHRAAAAAPAALCMYIKLTS